MGTYQSIGTASDHVMEALTSGLELEFGTGAGEALAQRFLEAEEADFHWDARTEERWLGQYRSFDDEGLELDQVKIIGRLDGKWFVARVIVDGDGNPQGMLSRRSFRRMDAAREAFVDG